MVGIYSDQAIENAARAAAARASRCCSWADVARAVLGSYTVHHGDMWIDQLERVCVVGTRRLALTPNEYALIEHLMVHLGQVCPSGQLMAAVWPDKKVRITTILKTYISYLRAKLDSAVTIRTVRGQGYTIDLPEVK